MQHLDRDPGRGNNIQGKYIILLIVRIKIDMIVRIEKEKYVRLPVKYEYIMQKQFMQVDVIFVAVQLAMQCRYFA